MIQQWMKALANITVLFADRQQREYSPASVRRHGLEGPKWSLKTGGERGWLGLMKVAGLEQWGRLQ